MNIDLKDYKNIVDKLHEGIFILDKNFKIVFTNHFFSNLIEWDRKNIINKSFIKLLDIKQAEMFGNHIDNNINKTLNLYIKYETEFLSCSCWPSQWHSCIGLYGWIYEGAQMVR